MRELDHQGIVTYCINLDAAADAYVSDLDLASTRYRQLVNERKKK